MANSNVNNEDTADIFFGIIMLLIVVIGLPIIIYSEYKTNKEYGPEKYEIVITHKWDDLGSNWHLVGGRATETEYHIEYKYRCINRPDNKVRSQWQIHNTTVGRPTYDRMHVGKRYTQEGSYFIW